MIERVRTADGEPVVYCIDKLAKEIADLSGYNEESLLTVIHNNTHITYAVAHIERLSSENLTDFRM